MAPSGLYARLCHAFFSYLIKVVALLIFICCYQHVLVNKDIH